MAQSSSRRKDGGDSGLMLQAMMSSPVWSSFVAVTRLAVVADLLKAVRGRGSSMRIPLDLTGSQRRQLKRLLQDRDQQLQLGAKQLAVKDDTIEKLVRLFRAEASAKKRLLSREDSLLAELQRQQQQLEQSNSCNADQLRQLGLQTSTIANQQTQLAHKDTCIADQQSQMHSLTTELSSCQHLLSEKGSQIAHQQAQIAAEEQKLSKIKEAFHSMEKAAAAARAERDAAVAEGGVARAKADSNQQLLGRVATQLSTLKANLKVERHRALTAEQHSADSATYVEALLNKLAAKEAELQAARSRPYALAEFSSGAEGVQGQVQWEQLPCDQQGASSHTNPLYTAPGGPWGAAMTSTSPQQVCHGLPDNCFALCSALEGCHTAA